jgi:hypothetical protein
MLFSRARPLFGVLQCPADPLARGYDMWLIKVRSMKFFSTSTRKN